MKILLLLSLLAGCGAGQDGKRADQFGQTPQVQWCDASGVGNACLKGKP